MLTIHDYTKTQKTTIKSYEELENGLFFKGSVIGDNTYIEGVDYSMGTIFPLLDHEFKRTGYQFSKDGNTYKLGDGLYLGKCTGKTPILTDDKHALKTVYDLGCDVVYHQNIDMLIDNATELAKSFKIVSTTNVQPEHKKRRITLPERPTRGKIESMLKDGGSLSVISAAAVQAKPISWLWSNWLPLGKLTLLAGVGGCGKTNILLNLIATITTGGKFPCGETCTNTGEVLIYSTEDDIADTLKPRLIANGADLSKVFFINGKTKQGELGYFDASEDLPLLYEYAEGRNIKLLMIDPITSVVGKDINKANDVRMALQILVDFASCFNCAVVGITHFSKGSKGIDPTERIIGSQAFSALARMNWVASKSNNPDEPCIFTKTKTNIADLKGGFSYEIKPCTVEDIATTKIIWGEYKDGTAKQLLSEVENSDDDSKEKPTTLLDEARAFLVELLREHKEMKSTEVQRLAKEADISTITLRRAREIVCDRPSKKTDGWYWRLKHGYILEPSNAKLVSYNSAFPFT